MNLSSNTQTLRDFLINRERAASERLFKSPVELANMLAQLPNGSYRNSASTQALLSQILNGKRRVPSRLAEDIEALLRSHAAAKLPPNFESIYRGLVRQHNYTVAGVSEDQYAHIRNASRLLFVASPEILVEFDKPDTLLQQRVHELCFSSLLSDVNDFKVEFFVNSRRVANVLWNNAANSISTVVGTGEQNDTSRFIRQRLAQGDLKSCLNIFTLRPPFDLLCAITSLAAWSDEEMKVFAIAGGSVHELSAGEMAAWKNSIYLSLDEMRSHSERFVFNPWKTAQRY